MTELKQARYFDTTPAESVPVTLQGASHYADDDFMPAAPDNIKPAVKKSSWWWRLLTITLSLVVILAGWQWGVTVKQSWQHSVLYGGLVTAVSLALLLLLATLIWRELKLWRRLARNRQWQQSAERIRNSVQYGEAGKLCLAVAASLPAEPAITAAVTQWQAALKDEHSDEEQLQLFERFVMSQLDARAQQLIYRAATDTSVAVAVIPFALADMLLVLWRSSRLLRELAQLYGGAIGQLRSLVLLKRLFTALLWAGGSELALDMASDVIGSELTAKLSARAGQGVIAGLLVARLGNLAQQQLRPLPVARSAKVSLKSLAQSLFTRFKKAAPTKADSAG